MQDRLIEIKMDDGSRHFYDHPAAISWDDLLDHLETLDGLEITGLVTDDVVETWADFDYREKAFSINEQDGVFRFFSEDGYCPEDILLDVVEHCGKIDAEKA